ncbi:MAG: hypothetical protein CM1200mP29_15900 [Verrucomicrobiota bacterium]|nr:MAG: hypothetical protein CM1200mP29_15900 [Verrucomicrobiota bacterium]
MVVQNQLGLHARPASMFVKMATRFKSEILVVKEGEEINGKSIMGLMMLAAGPALRSLLPPWGVTPLRLSTSWPACERNFEEE